MITARETIKQCSNSMFVSEQSELVDRLVYAFHEYAREAIKADRLNLLNYAQAKQNHDDYGTGEIWVDEKSIINAPNIKLL